MAAQTNFIDIATIWLHAGKGGDGAVSFHREKFVAAGGPDGGDGGRGGDIIFVADDHLSTLMDFRYKRKYVAPEGGKGGASLCHGKNAENLVIKVPLGTVIKDAESGLVIADLSDHTPVTIARGGRGGYGNAHFATPTRQIPKFAKPGMPGEDIQVTLELKLIADVGLIGFPNVGKSTLFNKLCGQRLAIVEDTPGITRDRIFANCEWSGHEFLLVDTGGIEPNIDDGLLAHMREQAQIAIDSADCIIMVGEIGAGVTAQDQDIAGMLMRSGKPVVLAVNKCDKVGEPPMELYDFYSLGIGDIVPISSVHGHGTGDLLDTVCENLHFDDNDEEEEDRIPVAVIGRPNVGKSSLINHILGENRLIVANEAGTTRDAIDTMVENQYGKFIFTDTAGLRKRGKVESGVERYSVLRSLAAVERSRVCVIMIDATVGFTEQDSKVAGYAHDQGKACIIAVNKWDAVEKDSYTMDKMRKQLEEDFSFMSYAPILFISAKTGQRLDKLFETIQYVDVQNGTRIPTGALNEMLARSTARVQPPSDKGKRLKIFYITQSSTRPPTFVAFVNQKALFHFSYQRYIENQIRENFGLTGTPMRLLIREHGDGSAR